MNLFPDQQQALEMIKTKRFSITGGGPGTGKSTTLEQVTKYFQSQKLLIEQCAPTGKASKRMHECTGIPARTIHSLLEPMMYKGAMNFNRNEQYPLGCNVLICDEFSMADNWLTASLLRAVRDDTRVIFVGDTYQLPSVGAGNVLRELIDSGVVPYTELTIIKRQEPGLIVTNCHAIKNGEMIELNQEWFGNDFVFIELDDPMQIQDRIVDLVKSELPEKKNFHPMRDIQVISPTREKTDMSCQALNERLQKALNPNPKGKYYLKVGDKVIQKKNEYDLEIINGDMGYVESIDFGAKKVVVQFENPERMVTLPMTGNNLHLAYAVTCHSYQGSEAPCVVIPVHGSFPPMLMQRNWLYTAVSRARELCVVVGQVEAIEKTIGRNRVNDRYTQLAEKLNPELGGGNSW